MYNVMIVDDEYAIRENLPLLIDFNLYGFKVTCTAENGIQALERLHDTKIDLIVLDSKMPEMDGLEFLNRLSKTEHKDVQIIILSGYSDFNFAQQAFQFKVNSYLTKPVDEDKFCILLKDIKNRLDKEKELFERKKLEETVVALRIIFHTNSKISNLENHGVLTIIPTEFYENSNESPYDIVMKTVNNIFGKICFRFAGSVHSLLINNSILDKYHGLQSFINTIKNKFKKQNLKCEIFYTNSIMKPNGKSFKNAYDDYVESVLSKMFYEKCVSSDEREKNKYSSYLSQIISEIEYLCQEKENSNVNKFFISVKESRLNISEIVKLTDKIYYMLENILISTGNEASSVIEKINFLEDSLFVDFEKWSVLVFDQFTKVSVYLKELRDKANRGICNSVIEYVNINFSKSITIKDIAASFYLNPSYLGRIFKKATGVSFNKYINDLRIEKAKKMLLQSDAKIYEISNELGYSESKYFIVKFTQEVGITPGEYRKNNLG